MANSFQAKIAARGYHVYKNLAGNNAKQIDFVTVEIETEKELKKKKIHIALLLKLWLTYHYD